MGRSTIFMKCKHCGSEWTIGKSVTTIDKCPFCGKPLTTINMTFLSPVPKGTEIVTTMALDNAGIMHIIATEELNGSSLDTTFELSNQMNESEIEEANSRMLNMKVE
jgi:transposase-like protein